MNKTITIYELLGLVKDGKELPKLENEVEKDFTYYVYDQWGETCNLKDLKKVLNDTVEIIEDNDKLKHGENYVDFADLIPDSKFDYLYEMESKIIDHINKIEERLDER